MNDIYGQTCNYEYFLNNEEEIKQNAYNIADPTSRVRLSWFFRAQAIILTRCSFFLWIFCYFFLIFQVGEPAISVFKGYRLAKESEEYLASHGLKNAMYSMDFSDVRDDLFGILIPCPFRVRKLIILYVTECFLLFHCVI